MDKKQRPSSTSSNAVTSFTSSQRSLSDDEGLQCMSATHCLEESPNEVQSVAVGGVQAEESAEEVLQASINFRSAHTDFSPTGSLRNEATVRAHMLYPSLDATPLSAASGEEKREETAYAMAGASSLPNVVPLYFEDDDPVTRKLMEEERLTWSARMRSMTTPYEAFEYVDAEDSKPPAQEVAYASAYQDDLFSDGMNLGVRAELVRESDDSLHRTFLVPSMDTVSMTNDFSLTEEAIVLDSKPAALPSGWSNESAEATVLGDSPQDDAVWTTSREAENLEEIAVTGIDEAEATIVEIAEDVHPADLDSPGVQAELIGRDYSHGASLQGSHAWDLPERSGVLSEATPEYTFASARDVVADGTLHGTIVSFADEDVAGLATSHVERDYSRGDSLAWTGFDQPFADSTSQLLTMGVEQAMIVDITEDLHPADLDGPGVQAEFVGRDFSQGEVLGESQAWAEPVNREASVSFDNYALATATNVDRGDDVCNVDSGATVVAFAQEIGRTDPRAEPARAIVERTGSYPGSVQQTQALLVAPIGLSHRSVSAPVSQAPLEYYQNNLTTRGAMDSSTMNSTYPVKETPPPIPSRSAAVREHSHNSIGSQFSRASSNGDGGNGIFESGQTGGRCASAGSLSSGGELLSQAQKVVNRSRANVMRHTNNARERWFGSDANKADSDLSLAAGSLLPRTLLPWSVFPSETTGMWVATVNTNQKALDSNDIVEASKALRAFSVPTREQAEALARAWAPPRMLAFSKNSRCFICEARFAVFKRPCHCRNCGVCVCSSCTVQWPSKMIPDTYNIKQESIVNICKSCDWLCSAFRMAMLDGNLEQAVIIHSTNNVNLVTPFANVKGELL